MMWKNCEITTFLSLSTTVAGKKGKMMERRILKDFQIGIVESIVNEAVKSSTETRDVFTSIAKAITKRAVSKKYESHWNEYLIYVTKRIFIFAKFSI